MSKLICPVCGMETDFISTSHIRKHGFSTALEFKKAYSIPFLRSDRLRSSQSSFMHFNSPTKGGHRPEALVKMSKNRKGRGVGVAGKYERTPEIRARISKSVSDAHGRHVFSSHILIHSPKLPFGKAFVRSSWEARLAKIFDSHPGVVAFEVEPFRIPYEFEGVSRIYIPDFLVILEGFREVWEVKADYLDAYPKTQAKLEALNNFVASHGMNACWVNLSFLESLEKEDWFVP